MYYSITLGEFKIDYPGGSVDYTSPSDIDDVEFFRWLKLLVFFTLNSS